MVILRENILYQKRLDERQDGKPTLVLTQDLAPLPSPPANVTQGYPNVAQLTMTAQFYRHDALTAPNVEPVQIPHDTAVTARKRKGHNRTARRPLVMSFLLSLQ